MQVFKLSCKVPVIVVVKLECSRQIFEKYLSIKFHITPSSGRRVAQYGGTNGRTKRTSLIVAFRNFVKAPKGAIVTKLMTVRSEHLVLLCAEGYKDRQAWER